MHSFVSFPSLHICSTEIPLIAAGNLVYKHGLPWLPSLQEIVCQFLAEGLNSEYVLNCPFYSRKGKHEVLYRSAR